MNPKMTFQADTQNPAPPRPGQPYVPRVADLMTSDPVSVSEDDTLKNVLDLLQWKGIRHMPVTRSDRSLVGLITQRDFLTVAVSKLAHTPREELARIYASIRVGDVMGRKVQTTTADALLGEAAEQMFTRKYGCLPVVDFEGRLIGIITEADFVRSFMDWEVRFKTP